MSKHFIALPAKKVETIDQMDEAFHNQGGPFLRGGTK